MPRRRHQTRAHPKSSLRCHTRSGTRDLGREPDRGLAGIGAEWGNRDAVEPVSPDRRPAHAATCAGSVERAGRLGGHLPRGPGVAAELQDQDVGRGEHGQQDDLRQGGDAQEQGERQRAHQAAEQGVRRRLAGRRLAGCCRATGPPGTRWHWRSRPRAGSPPGGDGGQGARALTHDTERCPPRGSLHPRNALPRAPRGDADPPACSARQGQRKEQDLGQAREPLKSCSLPSPSCYSRPAPSWCSGPAPRSVRYEGAGPPQR